MCNKFLFKIKTIHLLTSNWQNYLSIFAIVQELDLSSQSYKQIIVFHQIAMEMDEKAHEVWTAR